MEYGETERPIHWIIFNMQTSRERSRPTVISSTIVRICCWIICKNPTTFYFVLVIKKAFRLQRYVFYVSVITSFPFFLILKLGYADLRAGDPFAIIAYIIILVIYGIIVVIIKCQPLSSILLFKVFVIVQLNQKLIYQ